MRLAVSLGPGCVLVAALLALGLRELARPPATPRPAAGRAQALALPLALLAAASAPAPHGSFEHVREGLSLELVLEPSGDVERVTLALAGEAGRPALSFRGGSSSAQASPVPGARTAESGGEARHGSGATPARARLAWIRAGRDGLRLALELHAVVPARRWSGREEPAILWAGDLLLEASR